MTRARTSTICTLAAALLVAPGGCGSGDGARPGDESGAGGGGAPAPNTGAPAKPGDPAYVGNEGDGAGGPDAENADCKDLPVTLVRYCTRATKACSTPGANCPLYIVHNIDTPLTWVDDPARGELVATRAYGTTDGSNVRHWMAEVAVTVKNEYPGVDPNRVFFIGWSHGAGAAYRGLCHAAKGNGVSEPFGNNADIYAGVAAYGGCVACTDSWSPTGRIHVLNVNGSNDVFASDGCEKSTREWARDNACSAPEAPWQNVAAGDALLEGGDGTDIAKKLDYGTCGGGAVASYLFKDEGHVVSYKKHFSPHVSAGEMIWRFFQGKRK